MENNKKELKFYVKNLRKGLKLMDKVHKSKYGLSESYNQVYSRMLSELTSYLLQLKLLKRK